MPTTIPPEGPVDSDPLNRIELPEAPPKPHRRANPVVIGAIGVAAVIVFGLIALNVSGENPGGKGVQAPHGTWAPGPVEEWTPGHYEGPWVSFDYPKGFHEFYLSVGMQYFAAYGPVDGGAYDYVAVFPAPPETKGMTLEDFVKWNSSSKGLKPARPAQTVGVNGLPAYLMPLSVTLGGETFGARAILVKGERGDYLISCQYGKHAKAQVLAGCETLMHTLTEVPPPAITDASGCTDTELALLSSVPLPEGANPTQPRVLTEEGRHYCDLMVRLPFGHDGEVVDYFRSRMTEAGWDSEEAKMVRTFESYDVWQIIANRDWDECMVEVYVDDGHAHHFFVTVYDG